MSIKTESYEIDKRLKANGGKPLEIHRESIARYGKSEDVDRTLQELSEEKSEEQNSALASMMNGL